MAKGILLFYIALIGVMGTGYVKNVIKLSDCDFEAPYKSEVIHGIGLFPPIGAVTGWLNVGK